MVLLHMIDSIWIEEYGIYIVKRNGILSNIIIKSVKFMTKYLDSNLLCAKTLYNEKTINESECK